MTQGRLQKRNKDGHKIPQTCMTQGRLQKRTRTVTKAHKDGHKSAQGRSQKLLMPCSCVGYEQPKEQTELLTFRHIVGASQ